LILKEGKKIAKIKKLIETMQLLNKAVLAKKLGIARSTLYYKSKKTVEDERISNEIKEIIESNPSYGHRRVAIAMGMNHKKILRIMNKFGIKPKICRNRKFFKPGDIKLPEAIYKNEIAKKEVTKADLVWAGDFTYIKYRNSFIYLATVIDLFTKEIIGFSISKYHNCHLVKSALLDAIQKRHKLPQYFHSDQGSEYRSEKHAYFLTKLGVIVSMSRKSSPWQNCYQESFYSQFKLELGNPNRFETEDHLCEAIYYQIYYYNRIRIHSTLNMSPNKFYVLTANGRS